MSATIPGKRLQLSMFPSGTSAVEGQSIKFELRTYNSSGGPQPATEPNINAKRPDGSIVVLAESEFIPAGSNIWVATAVVDMAGPWEFNASVGGAEPAEALSKLLIVSGVPGGSDPWYGWITAAQSAAEAAASAAEAAAFAAEVESITSAFRLSGIAALLALSVLALPPNTPAFAVGYNNIFDGGGGQFSWQPSSTVPADAGMVFLPTGQSSGTAGRWVRVLEDGQPISLQHYGCVGGSSTDDVPRVAAAWAASVSFQRSLYVPPHTTYLSPSLRLTAPGQAARLIGDGFSRSKMRLADQQNLDFVWAGEATDVEVDGLTLDGNKTNNSGTPGAGGAAVRAVKAARVTLRSMRGLDNWGDTLRAEGVDDLMLDDCHADGCRANGFYTIRSSDGTLCKRVRYINSTAIDTGYDGFCIDPGTQSFSIVGCHSAGVGGTGFNVFGAFDMANALPEDTAENGVITGCSSFETAFEGLSLHACRNVVVTGLTMLRPGRISTEARGNGIMIYNNMEGQGDLAQIIISNITIDSPYSHGIWMDDTTTASVSRIQLSNINVRNPGAGFSGLYANRVSELDITNFNVTDDRIPTTLRSGIRVTANTGPVRVYGGTLPSGSAGQIEDPAGVVTWIRSEGGRQRSNRGMTLSAPLDDGLRLDGSTRPRLILDSGNTTLGRIFKRESGWHAMGVATNLSWNGTYNLDDTTLFGVSWEVDASDGTARMRFASAGANPRTTTTPFLFRGAMGRLELTDLSATAGIIFGSGRFLTPEASGVLALITTDLHQLRVGGVNVLSVDNPGGTGTGRATARSANSSFQIITGGATNTLLDLVTNGTGAIALRPGGLDSLRVLYLASAVNYLTVTPAVADGEVKLEAAGASATVHKSIAAKGLSGQVRLRANGKVILSADDLFGTATSSLLVRGGAGVLQIVAQDSGADTDIEIDPKGAGRVKILGPLQFTPGSSVTPAGNGSIATEFTSDTTLTIRARGSDGVVRSSVLTLA